MINEIAYAAQSRYATLIDGWRSIFTAELMSSDFSASATRARVGRRAWAMAFDLYYKGERKLIAEEISRVSETAQGALLSVLTDTQRKTVKDALIQHQNASVAYLNVEIEMLVRLDVVTLKQRLMESVIDIERRSRLRGIPKQQALIEIEMTRPQIGRRDSAGRLFSSDIVARNAWRLTLLGIQNEIVLQVATALGARRVKIMKPDRAGPVLQGHVSLDGLTDGLDFETARRQFFHPNSNAYLEIENV